MYEHMDLTAQEVSKTELDAELRSIERRLSEGEDVRMAFIIPEAGLFANSFYGYSLINISLSDKVSQEFREHSRQQLQKLIEKISAMKDVQPYVINANLKPPGGIILAGHTNLLRAGYVIIGGKNKQIIEDFHHGSEELSAAFLAGRVPFPECYPGYTWAQDSIFALESLRLHDHLFKTDYSRARNRWFTWMKEHVDPESKMMVTQISPDGEILDGPRGCAIAWALAFMPQLDPEFAHQQFAQFRSEDWFKIFGGMLGIREWYRGVEKPTQFHTGPVLFGLGAAASGIGIAACRSNGDYASWNRLLRALETLGFPYAKCGEKSYYFNQCLLADVLALWGKTICRWDSRSAPATVQWNPIHQDGFFGTFACACLASLGVNILLIWRVAFLCKDRNLIRPQWQPATVLAFVLQASVLLALMLVPSFPWTLAIVFSAVIDVFEELTIRPAIVRAIFFEKPDDSRSQEANPV